MFTAIGLIVALACLAVFLLLAIFKTSVGPFLGLVWADVWGLAAIKHYLPSISFNWISWAIIPWYMHVLGIAFGIYAVYTLYKAYSEASLTDDGTTKALIRTAFTWPAVFGLTVALFG